MPGQELVGRERELTVLAGCLADAATGRTRVLLCQGEPGIGKTRLSEELVAIAGARRIPAVWGRVAEGAPPYWPWQQVLGALDMRLPVGADLAPLLADGVPRRVDGEPRRVDGVLPRVDGAAADAVPDPDRVEQRFQLFDAAARYLRQATADRPLVIVLDDVHWADEPSLLLLGHLGRVVRDARLLLVATYRDTELADRHPLGPLLVDLARQPHTERLELDGLGPAEVGRRLAAVTGVEQPAPTVHRVHELSAGNPFFVGELGRALARGPDAVADIPLSVRDAIRDRLDRLTPAARELLFAASITGRQFSVAVVAAMLDTPVLSCLQPLDEAVAAGLVEPASTRGEHRFAHALVRDAVEAGLSSAERVRLHRATAEAIETFYAGRLEPHLSELAGHWAAAALVGDRARAASWARLAGEAAMRRLAFEEGARLLQLAVDVGGGELAELERFELLLALVDAQHRSADLNTALRTAHEAAALARRLGRSDLVGAVALVLEASGSQPWDRTARDLGEEALAGLPAEPTGLRARLLARVAEVGMYLDDEQRSDVLSRQALEMAAESGDARAEVAALRARQLACSGPDGSTERAELAGRMLAAGRALQDKRTQMWAHLWRVDTWFEHGDLAGADQELDRLAACVQDVRGPLARWNLLRDRAALAQAQGRFADALRLGDDAYATIAPIGHPAADPSRVALRGALGRHIGHDPGGADTVAICAELQRGRPGTPGEDARLSYTAGFIDRLGPAAVLAEAGLLDEAAALYRTLGPASGWAVGQYFRIPLTALGVTVATALGADDDVATLHEQLSRYRGRHMVSGAGVVAYLGPAELHLGIAAAHLDRLDQAVADLATAAQACDLSGAVGFATESRAELAGVLIRRGGTGDLPRARRLLARSATSARALGMRRIIAKIDELTARLDAQRPASALTPREREVAELVARGLTNREIAAKLVLSDRTAESHVQHILTKLEFANRSQIAAWVAGRD